MLQIFLVFIGWLVWKGYVHWADLVDRAEAFLWGFGPCVLVILAGWLARKYFRPAA